jgi:hypothetical protein
MNRTQRFIFRATVLLGLLSLCTLPSSHAGDDWLPVPAEDLALKDNPAQPGAHAMILYRSSHIDARRSAVDGDFDEEYIRIKIFTEEGAKHETNVEIAFLKQFSDIKDIRARTIRPDGSVVNFDGKVFEKTIEKHNESKFLVKAFTLPEVQPGSVVEYKYRQQFKPGYLHSEEWTVSRSLFTRDAVFSIAPYAPRVALTPTLVFRSTGLPQGSLPQRKGDGSYWMEIHNVPGIVEEPLMPPIRALDARVEFYYRAAGEPVGETTEQFWNRIGHKWSDELDSFLNKKVVIQGDLAATVAPGDSPEVKLRKIYTRVQKIRDLSYEPAKTATEKKEEHIKTDENFEDVLTRGYASGRQLNWFFIGLARAAGFEAYEVYLVPRNRDVFMPAGQNTGQLTADIVWVRANGKEYWIDPAALYYPFGLLPWYETETKGVRVTRSGADFVQTPAATSADATLVRQAELELKDDGSASGKLQIDFTGESGAIRRTEDHREDETGRRKSLEKYVERSLPEGSTFELTKIDNWDDPAVPLHVEGNVTLPALGSSVGHRLLVPVALFQSSFRNTFESEKRVNLIYFQRRYEEIDDLKIHGPAGFKIETIPAKKVIDPGTSLLYEISPAQQGEGAEVKRHFVLKQIHFSKESYPVLRAFFNTVKSTDEAQLVLQNAENAKNN